MPLLDKEKILGYRQETEVEHVLNLLNNHPSTEVIRQLDQEYQLIKIRQTNEQKQKDLNFQQINNSLKLIKDIPFVKDARRIKSKESDFTILVDKHIDSPSLEVNIFLESQNNLPNRKIKTPLFINDQQEPAEILFDFSRQIKVICPNLIKNKFENEFIQKIPRNGREKVSAKRGLQSLLRAGYSLCNLDELVDIEVIPLLSYEDVCLKKDLDVTLITPNQENLISKIGVQVKSSRIGIYNFLNKFHLNHRIAWQILAYKKLILINGNETEKKILSEFTSQLKEINLLSHPPTH